MKQLIQNMKVLRAMSGRFLTVAVVAAVAFAFNTQAQSNSGQGAVVTHIDRDATGSLVAISQDGQMRLDVVISGQGDFYRDNPDGTRSWQTADPKAPLTLSARGDNDVWIPLWTGIGSVHETALVDAEGNYTGESTYFHVQGRVTSAVDGSEWQLHVAAVQQDQEFKVLILDLQLIPPPRP